MARRSLSLPGGDLPFFLDGVLAIVLRLRSQAMWPEVETLPFAPLYRARVRRKEMHKHASFSQQTSTARARQRKDNRGGGKVRYLTGTNR